MSILHPEEHRSCRMCGSKWYAERYISKPSLMPALNYSTGVALARVAQAQDKMRAWEKYARCAQCGSDKVETLPRPTAVVKVKGPSSWSVFWDEMKAAWEKGKA